MKSKKVKVMLRGGLGNQLFQYAAAVELASQNNWDLEIDPLLLGMATTKGNSVSHWPNEIESFEHTGRVLTRSLPKLVAKLLRSAFGFERKIGDIFPRVLLTLGVFANEKSDPFKLFKKISSPVRINAYCSSEQYFSKSTKLLVTELQKVKNPSRWYTSELSNIEKQKAIGIHVRLGDYKNHASTYGIVDANYYVKALEVIERVNRNSPIWLFSDEPDLAHKLLGPYIDFDHVVYAPDGSRAIESLNLLSRCVAIVCANSSFSWWAAYLRTMTNDRSTIVFPRPMFDTPAISEPFNWLPVSWITMGRKVH